ncbi:phosphate acyltransferase, partial [Pseudomonas syringae pv. tagetis]
AMVVVGILYWLFAGLAVVLVVERVVLGSVLLAVEEVDGVVSGVVVSSGIRFGAGLVVLLRAGGCWLVCSVFLLLLGVQVLLFGVCIM